MSKPKQWGIIEIATGCWMGDDNGPKLFTDEVLAKAANTVLNERCDPRPLKVRNRETTLPPIFFRVKRYRKHGKRRHPDIVPLRSTLTAIKQIESRVPKEVKQEMKRRYRETST